MLLYTAKYGDDEQKGLLMIEARAKRLGATLSTLNSQAYEEVLNNIADPILHHKLSPPKSKGNYHDFSCKSNCTIL